MFIYRSLYIIQNRSGRWIYVDIDISIDREREREREREKERDRETDIYIFICMYIYNLPLIYLFFTYLKPTHINQRKAAIYDLTCSYLVDETHLKIAEFNKNGLHSYSFLLPSGIVGHVC
jgi:hypothetical protein